MAKIVCVLYDDPIDGYPQSYTRGKICNRDAIVRALESGRLSGYAGDVWFPQPAPKDHPWRSMPPHISGTSLSAQARYAGGIGKLLPMAMGHPQTTKCS